MAFDGGSGPVGGGPGEGGGGGGGDGPGEPAVVQGKRAVREDELWPERAEAAEARAAELEERVAELEARLSEAEAEASAAREQAGAEQRHAEIERRVREAGAVDVPTAMLLVEIELAGEDAPDVGGAVRGLRESKPYLFRKSGGARSSAMSASAGKASGVDLGSLAERARESGDRTALLRYLRGRRAV